MLGKVLAEQEEHRRQETSALTDEPTNVESYGTTAATDPAVDSTNEYAYSSDDDDDDLLTSDEEDDDDDSIDEESTQQCYILWRIWKTIANFVRIVANVDNLWDTSPNDRVVVSSRRRKVLVLFWFVVVATSYAGERSSFKWLVDRSGPFRLVMVQLVVLTNAILMGILYHVQKRRRRRALGISIVDVCIMAVLDTLAIVIMFISGAEVTPTLTVILLQWNIPLMAFWTHLRTTAGLALSHWVGSCILAGAVALALVPSVIALVNPEFFLYADAIPLRTAVQSLFYVSSCIPAAASQLYKEHVFLSYKQPVNMELLNLLLSMFQFILASILSPLAYVLQGMGFRDSWTKAYQSSQFGDNVMDAIRCFFGRQIVGDYPEDARCSYVGFLVVFHVFSAVSVGVAVDRIVNAGATKVMYRGISAGIILAVLVMHVYDMRTPTFNYGPAVDALNFTCLLLLIVGTEIYHRSGIPESTFETIYPPCSSPEV